MSYEVKFDEQGTKAYAGDMVFDLGEIDYNDGDLYLDRHQDEKHPLHHVFQMNNENFNIRQTSSVNVEDGINHE